ncbi:MAG: tRNA (N6-isopentenyl adenosine(37)-C2)-methylthiotransferase MiaB [Syntrophobacteraceae bacterium]
MKSQSIRTAPEPLYFYIHTIGCQMNEYDSLRVERILTSHGYESTTDIGSADVIFLNTCSVREKAEQKVHSFIGRLRRLKARNPKLKIVVGGCVAQQLGKQLLDRFDTLDLVLGTRAVSSIANLLETVQDTNKRVSFLPEKDDENCAELFDQCDSMPSRVAAPLTIMQGCDNFCTYCIVPYVRGRERSRPANEVIREIRLLVAGGAKEVLLLGQNVNSYGRGLDEKTSFADLLRRIQDETDIVRLRFTTSHPKDLTDDLIQCFAAMPRLCKHLHLPFQSGSDRVLKRMNRGYTTFEYRRKIDSLREICPEIAISSDVIVGFPGESEDDFLLTMGLIEDVQFDSLFSFRYSDRPNAKAANFAEKLDEVTKARRLTELQAMQASIVLDKNRAEVGRVREILVEGPSKSCNGQFMGRTQQNRIVNFEGREELVGRLVYTEIQSALTHSLRGKLIEDA